MSIVNVTLASLSLAVISPYLYQKSLSQGLATVDSSGNVNSSYPQATSLVPTRPQPRTSTMSKVYKALIVAADRFVPSKLRPLWEHEAGPKTIFFWAPAFKWALVGASLDDYRRPLDKVSTTQSATLAATGLIWTRYCLMIRPINYSLSICNFALGVANAVQCYRAYSFQKGLKTVA